MRERQGTERGSKQATEGVKYSKKIIRGRDPDLKCRGWKDENCSDTVVHSIYLCVYVYMWNVVAKMKSFCTYCFIFLLF